MGEESADDDVSTTLESGQAPIPIVPRDQIRRKGKPLTPIKPRGAVLLRVLKYEDNRIFYQFSPNDLDLNFIWRIWENPSSQKA